MHNYDYTDSAPLPCRPDVWDVIASVGAVVSLGIMVLGNRKSKAALGPLGFVTTLAGLVSKVTPKCPDCCSRLVAGVDGQWQCPHGCFPAYQLAMPYEIPLG